MSRVWWGACILLLNPVVALTQNVPAVQLPPPRLDGGRPLMQVLKDRHSSRSYKADELPPQVLSDLLWAAWGINRPESGGRTAPSAMNLQEIELYVVRADGAYLYEAKPHCLKPVASGDLRGLTGTQSFAAEAPLNLVCVAALEKMGRLSKEDADLYSAIDAGFISQNVYLYCASEGLATVVRGSIDRPKLATALGLGVDRRIVVAQTVGYPAK
jgi:SagB-type dehydrogenase family enzyme